jgi:hypothetical protein
VWQVVLGEVEEYTARGIPLTGTHNIGGSIVTAGGLVFIGSSQDEMIRAFDQTNGRVLWEAQLPGGGYANPCTYEANGNPYVVIAAGGGGKPRTRSGEMSMWRSRCREGLRSSLKRLRRIASFLNQRGLPSGSGAIALSLLALTWNSVWCAEDKALAPAAKSQPFPFSDKLYTQFFPECLDCHQISSDGWTMSYPEEEKCTIQSLRPSNQNPRLHGGNHGFPTAQLRPIICP